MLWKIELSTKKLVEFLEECNVTHNFLKVYNLGDTIEIYHIDYYGYAEPVEFYEKHKRLVKDVWWLDMTCADPKIGKDASSTWHSCKKESLENK